jgi:hypothetical protein
MGLRFPDDTSSLVNCGSAASLDNIVVKTITAWIFNLDFGDGAQGYVVSKEAAGGQDLGWHVQLRGAGGPGPRENFWMWQGWTSTNGVWKSPDGSIATGEWYHLAAVYDGSSTANDAVLYINGESVTVTETSAPSGTIDDDSAQDCLIGNVGDLFREFGGTIADLRIYNRLLSAAEIATIHAARGVDGIVSGLVSRWFMDEGPIASVASGTDETKDLAENKNDGTPSGTGEPTYREDVIRSRRRVA